jgi:methyltransferase-like protein 6
MTDEAKLIIEGDAGYIDESSYNKLEEEAKRNWDIFYKVNKTNAYHDRHYIKREFAELVEEIEMRKSKKEEGLEVEYVMVLDMGCGVGNGFYPLIREFEGFIRVNCCDFSPRAIDYAK